IRRQSGILVDVYPGLLRCVSRWAFLGRDALNIACITSRALASCLGVLPVHRVPARPVARGTDDAYQARNRQGGFFTRGGGRGARTMKYYALTSEQHESC